MNLREFGAVLAGAYPASSHYRAGKERGNYVVWHEYGGKRRKSGPLLIRKIQVDFFTRTEFDPALDGIKAALGTAGVAFQATRTFYEEDTGYLHHVILCEVIDRG